MTERPHPDSGCSAASSREAALSVHDSLHSLSLRYRLTLAPAMVCEEAAGCTLHSCAHKEP